MLANPKRMIDRFELEAAGRHLLGAVVGGAHWVDPLENLMPLLGAFGGGLARVAPPTLFGLPTYGVVDIVEAIAARRTPPVTRLTRVDPTARDGFVCDQMDAYRLARARDPFCQEFLRPRGVAYQASALLDLTSDGPINFMMFRGPGSGGFEPGDLADFSCILPYVRAATMASRATLRLGADRAAAPFEGRGDPVIRVTRAGTVSDCPSEACDLLAPDVRVIGGRLTASSAWDQGRIDRALTAALSERRPSLVTLTMGLKDSLRLLFIPMLGLALDVFHATAALVVALDVSRAPRVSEASLDILARSIALTRRERDVARVIAAGRTPREAAAQLGIGYETTRLHLKAVFGKAGIHSQGELVALLHRISCH